MIGFIGSSGDRAMLNCQKCQRVPKIKIAAKGFFNPGNFWQFRRSWQFLTPARAISAAALLRVEKLLRSPAQSTIPARSKIAAGPEMP